MTEQETTQAPEKSLLAKCQSGKICIPALGAMGVGLITALIFAIADGHYGMARFMFSYLISFAFFLSISLGSLFFVLIQYISRAGWSVTSRRVAEVLAMTMPVMAIAFLPIAGSVLLGNGGLYPWAIPYAELAALADHKQPVEPLVVEGQQVETHGSDVKLSAHDEYAPKEHKASHVEKSKSLHAPTVDLSNYREIPGVIDIYTEAIYTKKKVGFLNAPFFIIRWIVFFAIWIGLSFTFWKKSVEQDTTGDPMLTRKMERLAAPSIVLFALTVTFGAFDLLMSLSPAWFSTIFGVYYFSGAMLATFATLILVLSFLKRQGIIDDKTVNKEHLQDHGKFMFGFVVFWAYIAFSQYMLIWYASLPETTFWFVARGATTVPADFNTWSFVSIGLVLGHFLLPFLALMSRHVKRTQALLVFWAAYLLVFHWIDLWWVVMPEMSTQMKLGIVELSCLLGLGGLYVAAAVWIGSLNAIVPQKDPRLAEALAFKNM